MSTQAPEAPPAGSLACPRCATPLAPEQDWCLHCGAPARTRLAPRPAYRVPLVLLGAVIALALVVLALAFARLTADPAPTSPTPTVAAPVTPVPAG